MTEFTPLVLWRALYSEGVDVRAPLALRASADAVFDEVREIEDYPDWLSIVREVRPAPPAPGEGTPAWFVEIGARLGPLSRTKRVRMVRVKDERPRTVRFERCELDGREHSPWILTASIAEAPHGSELTMALHYGGRTFVPALELVLREEIRRAGPRLAARLETPPDDPS